MTRTRARGKKRAREEEVIEDGAPNLQLRWPPEGFLDVADDMDMHLILRGGYSLPVHRHNLRMASPILRDALGLDPNCKQIKVEGDPEGWCDVLLRLHASLLPNQFKEVWSTASSMRILRIAHKYEITSLFEEAQDWVKAHVQLVAEPPSSPCYILTWLQLADDLQLPELRDWALTSVQRINTSDKDGAAPGDSIVKWLELAEEHGWEGVKQSCINLICITNLSEKSDDSMYVLRWLELAIKHGWTEVRQRCASYVQYLAYECTRHSSNDSYKKMVQPVMDDAEHKGLSIEVQLELHKVASTGMARTRGPYQEATSPGAVVTHATARAGLRVVRNPATWIFGDKDGGQGNKGTLVMEDSTFDGWHVNWDPPGQQRVFITFNAYTHFLLAA